MKPLAIAVSFSSTDAQQAAATLAHRLGLNLFDLTQNPDLTGYDYLLRFTADYLELCKLNEKKCSLCIDFLSKKLLYRRQQAGLRKELIAKAMGLKPKDNPIIVDATAGLGRDSFILASLGFNVILLERSAILHALLQDSLNRAKQQTVLQPIISHMQLVHADALLWLPGKMVDVIYLDPMFPERKKSASVKKEMVILQDLLGKDKDAESLLELALTCATHRVVVKRPRLAESLAKRAPTYSLLGKTSRFDIYLTQTVSKK